MEIRHIYSAFNELVEKINVVLEISISSSGYTQSVAAIIVIQVYDDEQLCKYFMLEC
ncbi:hypothetical protein [Bacillus solimangrovi]|uniref:hypothetical protein n=1 Tax=Bacillus solimangrovi TaxID=1305675 RepID=UPI0015866376|nr:hypothetical protein [Bacillus solimangrovi]